MSVQPSSEWAENGMRWRRRGARHREPVRPYPDSQCVPLFPRELLELLDHRPDRRLEHRMTSGVHGMLLKGPGEPNQELPQLRRQAVFCGGRSRDRVHAASLQSPAVQRLDGSVSMEMRARVRRALQILQECRFHASLAPGRPASRYSSPQRGGPRAAYCTAPHEHPLSSARLSVERQPGRPQPPA